MSFQVSAKSLNEQTDTMLIKSRMQTRNILVLNFSFYIILWLLIFIFTLSS